MKLSIKALVITAAIMWAGAVFLIGIANLIWPGYGAPVLALLDSIYPGYHAVGTFGSVIVATLYGALDAAIAAGVFAWIYNRLACGTAAGAAAQDPGSAQ